MKVKATKMKEEKRAEFRRSFLKYKGQTPFCKDLKKIVPELKKEIEMKNIISMTPEDLRHKVDLKYRSRQIPNIFWDAKYCLWNEGIVIESSKMDHESIVQLRARTPADKEPVI